MHIQRTQFKKGIRGTDEILYEEKPQIAFVGRSNVGKSSLINCLLNSKDLVKSSQTPGKTKELNFFLINGDFYVVDLPGYGFAKLPADVREQLAKMIQWYIMEPVFKRKVILVLDVKAGPTAMDIEMLRILREHNQDVLVAVNKIDSLKNNALVIRLRQIAEELSGVEIVPCSTVTKEGRLEILKKISDAVK